ncbi:MAG TPA: hypothetical protein VEZ90_17690 [Blastocatellia bacterium]|nr:hypothetical protein [Blastocatellia bacterium]
MADVGKDCGTENIVVVNYRPPQKVNTHIDNSRNGGQCKVVVEYDVDGESAPDKKRFPPGTEGDFPGDDVTAIRISCRKGADGGQCKFSYTITTG